MADETAQRIDRLRARAAAETGRVSRLRTVVADKYKLTSRRFAAISLPFQGATRPATTTTRISGNTPQTRRKAAMRSPLMAAGLNVSVSIARGMTVMRSAGMP
jgi:hypothetical protein